MGLPSVLAETNASGTITAYYVYGLGLVSKIEGSNAYFYQYDGVGSTVAITNTSGVVVNKYAYDDFGSVATNSTETIGNSFKYVGQFGVMTDTNDLYYMRARYYIPSIGRFISKDPIGFAGGLNFYAYVENNPINWIDPSGEIAIADDIAYYFIGSYIAYYVATHVDWRLFADAVEEGGRYISGMVNRGICHFAEHTKGKRPSTYNKHTKSHSSKKSHRAKERLIREGKWHGR